MPRTPTPTVDQVDDFHGELVADPYRWLEDTTSAATAAWCRDQNERTERFLAALPQRQEVRDQLARLWDYPRADPPFERGGRWFQWRNSGLQDQAVLYVMASPGSEGRPLLDPNEMSADGTVAVAASSVADDGSLLAYATSAAGSDWMTWHVRDVVTGEDKPDRVEWAKFSGAAWRKDGSGFFYSSAERPEAGHEYTAKTGLLRIFFHAVGTPQEGDRLVFERPDEPEWSPSAAVADDGDFLVVTITKGTAPQSRIEVVDLSSPDGAPVVVQPAFEHRSEVVTNVGRTFYLLSDDGAGRRRALAVDLDRPERERWREVVAEQAGVLTWVANCGGRLVCHYLDDACSRLSVHLLDGAHVYDIDVPPLSSLDPQIGEGRGLEGRPGSTLVHFSTQSFTDSGSLWSHDLASGRTVLVQGRRALLERDDIVTEQVFVEAGDGARLPLFLTRRGDLAADGRARVLLYGYGGFDIALTPSFNRAQALFVQRGGVLAVACLRGGGEYGREWHDAGRLANKQRVFDDFCDCARWLARSGWSSPAHIAINGASNGGLLVGACLTQHPELFGAAVPEVGVHDMLRFHLFTIGWAWKSDFGDPGDSDDYRALRAYSPLHNVRAGTSYPPTLVMTGDHDDRVVPGHSFKFAAALQAARHEDGPPVLVRVEMSAGHGHGKPTSKAIAERADMLTFTEWALSGAPPPA